MKNIFTLLVLVFLWTSGMTQVRKVQVIEPVSTSNVAPKTVHSVNSLTPLKVDQTASKVNNGKAPFDTYISESRPQKAAPSHSSKTFLNPRAPMQGGDIIANATLIPGLPYNNTGTTAGYADDYNEVCPYDSPGGPDVVYMYTPTVNGTIDISLCGDITEFDTRLFVYDVATPLSGDAIACNDDFCSNAFSSYISEINGLSVNAGVTYYIVVDGYSDFDFGIYEINVTTAVSYPVPANDDCTGAVAVAGPFPQTVNGTTLGATVDCPGDLDWNAVWYAVTLPYTTNDLTVNWCGTANMNSVGVVYYNSCPVVCGNYNLYNSNVFSICGTPAGATTALTTFLGIPGPTTIYFPAYSVPQMDHVITFDVIDGTVTCPSPTELAVTNITNTSADLNWTANGTETSWNIEVGLSGFTVDNDEYVIANSGSENPFTATPLAPGTAYDFYVQADCGGDLSIWVGPFSFYTSCAYTCPSGSITETEDCGEDLNGGCNMDIPAFEMVNAGDIICGTTWAEGGFRDTDWFSITLTEPQQVILHATAGVPLLFGQLDYGTGIPGAPICPVSAFISNSTAPPCVPTSLNLGILVAGTHWFFAGIPTFEGYACGSKYSLEFEVVPLPTCDPISLPYFENFDGVTNPTIPACMTVTNDNNDIYQWMTNTGASYVRSAPNSMRIRWNSILEMDDWFFTPALDLQPGTYNVSFWYASAGYTEALEVKWGNAPNAAGMTSAAIFDNNSIENQAFAEGTGTITITTAGVYYVGWHGYSDADQFYLMVDDISITEASATKTLNLSGILLEGLYNGSGTMRQANNDLGPEYGAGIADAITVELHNASNYSVVEYTAANVMLGTDGTATNSDIPDSFNGQYYITIKHRNSIETTTATAVSFAGGIISQSFAATADVYGGNLVLMIDGFYAIYGGDVNQDLIIDTQDIGLIDFDISNFATGYVATDANGDGLVDTNDTSIVDRNISNFVTAILP